MNKDHQLSALKCRTKVPVILQLLLLKWLDPMQESSVHQFSFFPSRSRSRSSVKRAPEPSPVLLVESHVAGRVACATKMPHQASAEAWIRLFCCRFVEDKRESERALHCSWFWWVQWGGHFNTFSCVQPRHLHRKKRKTRLRSLGLRLASRAIGRCRACFVDHQRSRASWKSN